VDKLGIKIKDLGTMTETQVGYKVVATCQRPGGCYGTVIFSPACTGTVGPLAPGQICGYCWGHRQPFS